MNIEWERYCSIKSNHIQLLRIIYAHYYLPCTLMHHFHFDIHEIVKQPRTTQKLICDRLSYSIQKETCFASFFCIRPRKMPSSLLDMNKSLVLSTDRLIACWLGHSRCVSLCSQDEKLFQSMTVMTKHDQDHGTTFHYIRNNILITLDRPRVFLNTSSVL